MKLMFIQKAAVTFGNFKNLAAQTMDDAARCQKVIAFDSILIGCELDADHEFQGRSSADPSQATASCAQARS
jgi:hypothetical protein